MNKEAILKEFEDLPKCKHADGYGVNLFDAKIKVEDLLDQAEAEKAEAFNQGKVQGLMEARMPDKYVCTTSNTAELPDKEGK